MCTTWGMADMYARNTASTVVNVVNLILIYCSTHLKLRRIRTTSESSTTQFQTLTIVSFMYITVSAIFAIVSAM